MAALTSEAQPDGHVFEDIADAMPHMVWLAGPDGGTTYHNRRILEYTGLPAGMNLGTGWERVVHADDVLASRAAWLHSIETGEPFEIEYRLRRHDGVFRRFLARAHTQLDGRGKVVRWVGTCTDIEELRRTAELLKAVADGTTDAVFVKDRDGKYLLANPATARFVGRADGDLLGRTDAELFDPDSARRVAERDRQVMGAGVAETDVEVLTAAGVTRTYLATKAPYRDEDGAVIGVIGITRDVTELKRMAEERDALLARLQLQFERMPLAYVQFDADLRVTDWNPAAERIFGFPKDVVLGMGPPFEKIVPVSFRAEAEPLLARIKAGDMAAHSVNQNLTKDGRTITCEWFNTPLLDDNGNFTGLLCLAQDVTARKELEAQFQQAQKMEVVGHLAGGVAHDFNNLLAVILGCCHFLENDAAISGDSHELIEDVYKAANRAATLTRQLLAFSRQQILQPTVLNLNEVVTEAVTMLDRLIGEDIELKTDLSARLWPVKVDAGQMNQVVMNLAVNARDAMPEGGKLTIETANIELDETYLRTHQDVTVGPYVVLTISDNGCGMDEKTKARIFEPFFTTKETGKGTGLGLSTVFGVVKQSGGHVTVDSELGKGTTFKVWLPKAVATSDSDTGKNKRSVLPRGTETVLVVEDEVMIRNLACRILQSQGYTVLQAQNGDEALLLFGPDQQPIHLILTDVVMPKMGGRQLYDRLRSMQRDTKVLFMSGYTDDAIIRRGFPEAQSNFIEKPFTYAGLATAVRETLGQQG